MISVFVCVSRCVFDIDFYCPSQSVTNPRINNVDVFSHTFALQFKYFLGGIISYMNMTFHPPPHHITTQELYSSFGEIVRPFKLTQS